MSDINRLVIDNFQSHEHTVIEFGKGLNVITGPSDQGKSAILRALKWVLYNEPRGTEFIRHGASTARVSIELSNGYEIIRERSKSRNKYTVISPDGTVQSFEGFGNEVPEEVIKAHGIPKVTLDKDLKSSLNIADQLESPFLIAETGAVRAKAIGRLTGVHIIDNAIRECMVDIRRESQSEDRIRNQLKDISSKIDDFQYLDEMEKRLQESEELIQKLGSLIERMRLAENTRDRYEEAKTEQEKTQTVLKKLENLEDCETTILRCNGLALKLDSIKRLGQSLYKVEEGIRESEEMQKRTENLEMVKRLVDELDDKCSRKNSLEELNRLKAGLDRELKRCHSVLDASEVIKDVEHHAKLLESKIQRINQLAEINEKYRNIIRDMQKAGMYLNKIKHASLAEEQVAQAEKDILRLTKLQEIKQNLDSISSYITEGEKYLGNNKEQIDRLLEKYLGHLKVLGRCPLCGSAISDAELKDIIKHYEEVH